jgi:tRNA-2-methylthio-N6-dimethylallyladenosine synthase
MSEKRSVHVITYGCQMNAHDSDRMLELLEPLGFEASARDSADLIILNTCSVRDKADQKMLSELGRLRKWREADSRRILAVGGCVAQGMGGGLLDRCKHLDLVFGTDQLAQLPDMVERISRDRVRVAATEWRGADEFEFLPIRPQRAIEGCHAFVKIMKGCDKFCTYCIVPYVKGRELYRPAQEILNEVKMLVVKHGIREITLLGQTVTSYNLKRAGEGEPRFAGLLRLLHDEVPELARIRFMTGYPKDVHEDLLQAFAELPRLQPYIHMPVQSGSDAVLAAMKRGYDRALYVERMGLLRAARPGLALTSDIIVGFPGETEEDFQDTLSLMREIRYDSVFSFTYSERPGTRAEGFADQVPEPVRRRRLIELNALQDEITRSLLAECVGQTFEVMILGPSTRDPEVLCGRTPHNRMVNFVGAGELGELVEVTVEAAGHHTLRGIQRGFEPSFARAEVA